MKSGEVHNQAELLREAAGLDETHRLSPMGGRGSVTDASDKWWVVERSTNRVTDVLIRSSTVTPQQMAETVERQQAVVARLGERTAAVVLEPRLTGACEGRTFAVFPYRQPIDQGKLARRWWRWRMRGPVFGWLDAVVAESAREVDDQQRQAAFAKPLETLAADEKLNASLRDGAEAALRRIEAGDWQPRTTVVHNDLWLANILRAPAEASGGYGFVVIDWGLANPAGQPFYDLLRIADSLGVSGGRLRQAVEAHCQAVGCERDDARSNLLAGLGWLRQNLNYFPHDRFVTTAHRCVRLLDEAMR